MDGSTRSIADATSISHDALLLQCLWIISYRSTRHLDVENEVRHSIDHHRMAIVIYEWYLAHVDHMEVQFNNEGPNMFVHALSQSPFIPEQVSIAASSKPNHHHSIYQHFYRYTSRDMLPVLLSALCRSPYIYPVICKWSQHCRKFFHMSFGLCSVFFR